MSGENVPAHVPKLPWLTKAYENKARLQRSLDDNSAVLDQFSEFDQFLNESMGRSFLQYYKLFNRNHKEGITHYIQIIISIFSF